MNALFGVDLNLILPLHALVEEESVTKAAHRVGLSQPAMSHALARLREHFGDPLLVRSGRRMMATPRAQALREPVRIALEHIERALVSKPPDPSTLDYTIRVACDDYVSAVVLPRVLEHLQHEAPLLDLEIRPRGVPGRKALLRRGEADLAVGYFSAAGMDLHRCSLFAEGWLSVVREGHSLARRRTRRRWAQAAHIVVSPTGGRRGVVDRALEDEGLSRRVALTVPHFLAAFPLVAATDHVLTTPARLARLYAPLHGLRTFRPPLPLDSFEIAMLWHPRTHDDPGHRWLRARIAESTEDF